MSNLADEMRKKQKKEKKHAQKLEEEYRKREDDRLATLKKTAVAEAEQLFQKTVKEIEEVAKRGKDNVEFLVASHDSPSKEDEEKLQMVVRHLAQLLVDKNNNFAARPIVSISEEFVDSPRHIYVAVEIRW